MGKKDFLADYIGSHGNIIIYRVGDQIRTRTKPAKVRMPQTAAVVSAKMQFRRVNALAKSIYNKTDKLAGPEIKPNEGINAYSELVKIIRWSGVDSSQKDFSWNWDVLNLAKGSLETFDVKITNHQDKLSLNWPAPNEENISDWLYLIVIDTITEEVVTFPFDIEGAQASIDKKNIFDSENSNSKAVYVFRSLQLGNKILKSDSVFLGLINEADQVVPDEIFEESKSAVIEPEKEVFEAPEVIFEQSKPALFETPEVILEQSKQEEIEPEDEPSDSLAMILKQAKLDLFQSEQAKLATIKLEKEKPAAPELNFEQAKPVEVEPEKEEPKAPKSLFNLSKTKPAAKEKPDQLKLF